MSDNFQTGTLINFEQPIRRQFQGSGWNGDERKMSLELYKAEGKSREKRDYMTRLEAVKQLFQAFINRSQGYNYANHIGLITFGDDVDIKCKISPAYERFRNSLQRVHTNGDTRLFDAMKVAVDELLKWQKKYPEAKLRMLVLSDGADTNSEVAPSELARGMQDNNITCDAVCIGGESDKQLHCLAKCSGGYCFNPKTLVSALRLNELETMLSQCERPPKGEIRLVHNPQSLESFLNVKEDVCSDDVIPPRKEIDVVHQPVRALEDILKIQPEISGLSGINRKKRILKELKRLHKQPHPSVDVFPCETDMNFLQLLFEGPADTPYAGGVWLVDVVLPEDFPDVAPTLRFRTPIKHCNINMYGRVCHAIFGRGWSADTSLKMVIECVYGLFLNPEFDDPLDSALAAEYYEASGTYEFSIKEHTAKNFKHTREEWNAILSKEASDEERTELALKRDLIRRAEKPYIQKPDDFCFGCREKTNTLKRCACHLAVFCKKRFNHCKSISDHDCVCK